MAKSWNKWTKRYGAWEASEKVIPHNKYTIGNTIYTIIL
jgi:hypothetical protein